MGIELEDNQSKTTLVIHVVEAYGGGVASAVHQYIRSVPQSRHIILASKRHRTEIETPRDIAHNVTAIDWGNTHRGRYRRLRRLGADYPHAVFHAHSSFAGAYLRSAISMKTHRIVYTPHAYSFERRDIGILKRAIFSAAEMLLALNTTAVAACSPREAKLAKQLSRRNLVVHVPNIPDSRWNEKEKPRFPYSERHTNGLMVVGIGRLSAQKDPAFFASTVSVLRKAGLLEGAMWIGGGEPEGGQYEKILQDAGVDVTGWLPQEQVRNYVESADLLIHSALWEGFPLVILDALSLSVPTFVRSVPCFENIPSVLKIDTPQDILTKVSSRSNIENFKQNIETWNAFLREYTPEEQARKLSGVYGLRELAIGGDAENA